MEGEVWTRHAFTSDDFDRKRIGAFAEINFGGVNGATQHKDHVMNVARRGRDGLSDGCGQGLNCRPNDQADALEFAVAGWGADRERAKD